MSHYPGIFTFSTTNCTTVNQIFNNSGNGQALTGHVQKVVFTSTSWANGSVFLTDVATKELILSATGVSGTNPVVVYPRRLPVTDQNGVSLSGTNAQSWDKLYVHGPVQASGLGLGSTTAGTVGQIDIYYF